MNKNNFKGIFIDGTRSGYTPEQCDNTMTIDELICQLEGLKEQCGGDTSVYLYNDNGYTYGHINADTMAIGEYSEGKGVEFNTFEDYRGYTFD